MPAERNLAQPGFGMAVVLSLMVFAIQMWLTVPLTVLDELFVRAFQLPRPGLAQNPLMLGLINLLAFGAPIAWGLHLNRLPFRQGLALTRISLPQMAAMALTILGADVLLSEADNLFRSIVPPPRFLIETYRQVFTAEGKLVERIFLLVIVAPVTEELLFRGIILRGLLSRYRPGVAIGCAALLFALVHMNPWQFISAFWLGVAFGWFYVRTSSINICILGHAVSNGLFVFLTSLAAEIPGLTTPPESGRVVFQPLWLDLAGALMLLAGIIAFTLVTRHPQTPAASPPAPEHPPEVR